ncbi:hypothetical protein GCM10015535_66150 [Streptomyces gelaticus]|uniref:DUF397 domain-containing protein n=1 Tax=Streptomyces gelaticus TaxID=285446 RepID=A0ABQ2W950_9ACTN|nr:DUF397 domain-containing protein [Streptomyces gelaticus]GGV96502.1 hypothetical protein GCM10015535_66150 [Streptomyces gelaticus]
MPAHDHWQKSSHCAQGDSCLHVATGAGGGIKLTESGDPAGVVLRTTPGAWAALVRTLKESHCQD